HAEREAASCLEVATGDSPKVAQTPSRLARKPIANHRSVPPPGEDRTRASKGKRKLGQAPTSGRNLTRVAKAPQSSASLPANCGTRAQTGLTARAGSEAPRT